MPAENETICRGFLGTGSNAALFVHPNRNTVFGYWIPRSQVRRLSKLPNIANGRQEVEFTLPGWLVEKKNCHELAK